MQILPQGFECVFHQNDVQNLLFGVNNVIRHDKTQLHVLIDTRTTGEAKHTRELFALIVELPLIPREIYNALEAARSASSNREVKSLQIVC